MAYVTRVGERGQITIPKAVRDEYGLTKGMAVEVELENGQIRLRKRPDIRATLERYRGIIDIADVDRFVEDLRGR